MTTTVQFKTQTNVVPEIQLNSTIVNRANEPHYTCPAGKRAIFNGYVVCKDLGAATSGTLRTPTPTEVLATWRTTASVDRFWLVDQLPEEAQFPVKMELEAGEVIETRQNTGTNAEFQVVGTILELPVP